jgi:N6-adenosine-specific RNA methylase IME4
MVNLARPSNSAAIPEFLRVVIAEEEPASERAVAEQAVLALNSSMMTLYDQTLEKYKRNLRERVPIILALFSGAGGQMILYRPGHEPLVADPVPIVYQLAKSVGHSSMAIYQIVAPYLSHPTDQSWRGPLQVYRTQNQSALASLPALDISDDDRAVLHAILEHNLAFMDDCLNRGTFSYESIEKYIRQCAPDSVKTIGIAAPIQVGHWMKVVEGWKKLLGKEWESVYAMSNTLYVARQNNILFTVLAQFMGQAAMGDRLLLIETAEFTTTPEKMLEVLTRIVSDRGIGMVFFKDYFLMDVELLGGGGRSAIEREMKQRGLQPLLPSVAPFRSTDWPWKTDPAKGKGPAALEEIK